MGAAAATRATGSSSPPDGDALARLRRMWPPATRCTITGLQSDAGQQLNGLSAQVHGLDDKTGRLIVQLRANDTADAWKKLKPENILWDGITFSSGLVNESGEHFKLLDDIRAAVSCAVGALHAGHDVAAAAALHGKQLESKLGEAQGRMPPDDFAVLLSFAEQARSHASQWALYHELRTKPDLKLEGPHGIVNMASTAEKSLAQQVASTMKRAYWDKAREDLARTPPDLSFVLARVEELVETMAGFLPSARRDAFKGRVVDMSILHQQVANNAFDRDSLLDLVQRLAAALMELESPFQSARTKEWLDEVCKRPAPDSLKGFGEEVVRCLAHLFEKCDVLQVEVHNFGLEAIRATRLRDMERDVCTRMVKLRLLSMEVTGPWLATSDHGGNVEVAVIQGVARLATENGALPHERCPELLRLDIQRLHEVQSGLQCVALLGLVAILAAGFLPAGSPPEDVGKVFRAVAQETEKPRPQLDRICEVLEQGIADLRSAQQEPPMDLGRFDESLGALRKCLHEDVPAFRLLHDRARAAFLTALGPPKREVLANCLGESPWCLRFAAHHLSSVVEGTWTFLGEHLRVYGAVYRTLL